MEMEEKIKKKVYYRINFVLASPLLIGCGNNNYTDNYKLIELDEKTDNTTIIKWHNLLKKLLYHRHI